MPIVHIYTTEGWLGPKRKKLMIESVTDAVVAAEGVPRTREMTYVVIHEVADGGWGFAGRVFNKELFKDHIPPEPED